MLVCRKLLNKKIFTFFFHIHSDLFHTQLTEEVLHLFSFLQTYSHPVEMFSSGKLFCQGPLEFYFFLSITSVDIHEKYGNAGPAHLGFASFLASVYNSPTFPGNSSQKMWKTIPVNSLITIYLNIMNNLFVCNWPNLASIKIMDVENALFPVFSS